MKLLAAAAVATVLALGAASPAQAAQGCGPGFHRAPNGMCRPNRGQIVFVEGRFYPGRGYWYRNRWWHRRYRWHNEWRYH